MIFSAIGPQFQITHIVSGTVHAVDGDDGFYLQYDQLPCGSLIDA